MFRSIRTAAFVAAIVLILGTAGIVSAGTYAPLVAQSATATPIDSGNPIKLEFGKSFETPFDAADLSTAYFSFKGKANQLVTLTVAKLSGTFGLSIGIYSQSDVELAYARGGFVEVSALTTKLPQDGNYRVTISRDTPGAGDLEAGSVTVQVDEAKPTAAATKAN